MRRTREEVKGNDIRVSLYRVQDMKKKQKRKVCKASFIDKAKVDEKVSESVCFTDI